MDRAYYVNGQHQPTGRNPLGIRVESAEWLPIKEDPQPKSVQPDEMVETTHGKEGLCHRIRKVVRKKSGAELENESAAREKEGELAYWQATKVLFETGNVTQEMRDKGLAYLIGRL